MEAKLAQSTSFNYPSPSLPYPGLLFIFQNRSTSMPLNDSPSGPSPPSPSAPPKAASKTVSSLPAILFNESGVAVAVPARRGTEATAPDLLLPLQRGSRS
jgi:hypothetical protein